MVCKTANDFTCFQFCRRGALFRMGDQCREIFFFSNAAGNMFTPGETNCASGIHTVFVAFQGRYQTVCGQQHRAIECFEFFFLFPPCIAIVACKVAVFLECGIVVCRQHFRVCIHVYSCTFCLFQQHFQISQVVTGNQNTRIFPYTQRNLCHLWIAISSCICFIQHCHSVYAVFTCFHSQCHKGFHIRTVIQRFCQCFLQECINGFAFLAQCVCMFAVSSHAFQTIHNHFP